MVWGNKRFYRLLCWAGLMVSPSLHMRGIDRPTFKEAWTGVLYIGTSNRSAVAQSNLKHSREEFKCIDQRRRISFRSR